MNALHHRNVIRMWLHVTFSIIDTPGGSLKLTNEGIILCEAIFFDISKLSSVPGPFRHRTCCKHMITHHCFKKWLDDMSALSHYLNHRFTHITILENIWSNIRLNWHIFLEENEYLSP